MKPLSVLLAAASVAACAAAAPAKDAPSMPKDTCGAAELQSLVGKDRSAIPPRPAGAAWRVHSTETAVTGDYVETRLNIVWDAKTGKVVRVTCG
jgi:hypothetical protein